MGFENSHIFIEFNELFAFYGAWLSGVMCIAAPLALVVIYRITRYDREKRP